MAGALQLETTLLFLSLRTDIAVLGKENGKYWFVANRTFYHTVANTEKMVCNICSVTRILMLLFKILYLLCLGRQD